MIVCLIQILMIYFNSNYNNNNSFKYQWMNDICIIINVILIVSCFMIVLGAKYLKDISNLQTVNEQSTICNSEIINHKIICFRIKSTLTLRIYTMIVFCYILMTVLNMSWNGDIIQCQNNGNNICYFSSIVYEPSLYGIAYHTGLYTFFLFFFIFCVQNNKHTNKKNKKDTLQLYGHMMVWLHEDGHLLGMQVNLVPFHNLWLVFGF